MSDVGRLLNNIPFALNLPYDERAEGAVRVRQIFQRAGAQYEDAIIDLGCTGLVGSLCNGATAEDAASAKAIIDARFARSHMAGAGFGLPCYVDPGHWCLVHETIGGLQRNQAAHYQPFLKLCSRELTAEEQQHAAAVRALIDESGEAEAKRRFNAKTVEAQKEPIQVTELTELEPLFVCPEHAHGEMNWTCRYCIAQAIINGPLKRETFVEIAFRDGAPNIYKEIDQLAEVLGASMGDSVAVFVQVRKWIKAFVESEE